MKRTTPTPSSLASSSLSISIQSNLNQNPNQQFIKKINNLNSKCKQQNVDSANMLDRDNDADGKKSIKNYAKISVKELQKCSDNNHDSLSNCSRNGSCYYDESEIESISEIVYSSCRDDDDNYGCDVAYDNNKSHYYQQLKQQNKHRNRFKQKDREKSFTPQKITPQSAHEEDNIGDDYDDDDDDNATDHVVYEETGNYIHNKNRSKQTTEKMYNRIKKSHYQTTTSSQYVNHNRHNRSPTVNILPSPSHSFIPIKNTNQRQHS